METDENVVITPQERQEFEEYRRRKRIAEARALIGRLELDLTQPGTDGAAVVSAVKDAEKCVLGGVCVQPYFVNVCARPVKKLKVVCCISLCGGAETSEAKAFQVRRAVRAGAAAAEVTAPVPAVKEGAWSYVRRELKKLRAAAGNIELRMNAEAPLLTAQEAERLCSLAAECGVKCVRVSHGACDDEELSQIAAAVRGRMTVKSGGADTPARIATMMELGAGIVSSRSATELARTILAVAEEGR